MSPDNGQDIGSKKTEVTAKMTEELELAQKLQQLEAAGTFPETKKRIAHKLTQHINGEHSENGGGGS